MAEEAKTKTAAAPAAAAAAEADPGKMVVVVAVDDSEHNYYALEWTMRHVAAAMAAGGGAELVIVHAKPSPSSVVVSFGGPGAGEAMRCVEADLRKTAEAVVDRARLVCIANSVHALIEVMEGGAQVRALQRGREAPRGSAGRRQPWLRRHQKGSSGERERLLRPPRALLRHDREGAQVQTLSATHCYC